MGNKQEAADRKKRYRERQKSSAENSAQKGQGKTVINYSMIDDFEFDDHVYVPERGRNKLNEIDIIPFQVTQKWYPKLKAALTGTPMGVQVGDLDHKLQVCVHKYIGGRDYLCLKETFGQPCFICKERAKEADKKDPDEKALRAMKPGWIDVFNVFDRTERKPIVKIFKISPYNFTFDMEEDATAMDRQLYADLEEGYTIQFLGRKKKLGKNNFTQCENFDFIERKEPYDEDDVLEMARPLDKMLIIPTYEQVKQAFLDLDEMDDDDDEYPDKNDDDDPGDDDPPDSGESIFDLDQESLRVLMKDNDIKKHGWKDLPLEELATFILESLPEGHPFRAEPFPDQDDDPAPDDDDPPDQDDDDDPPGDDEPDILDQMDQGQLREYMKENDIKKHGWKDMDLDDLREFIREAMGSAESGCRFGKVFGQDYGSSGSCDLDCAVSEDCEEQTARRNR